MPLDFNLLAGTPSDHTWVEIYLDLEAPDFEIEHVRALRAALTRYLPPAAAEPPIIAISRWRPSVVLEMPQESAEGIVRSFEIRESRLLEILGQIPVESIRSDNRSARSFSIPARTKNELLPQLYRALSTIAHLDVGAAARIASGYIGVTSAKLLKMTGLALMVVAGGLLALLSGGIEVVRRLWAAVRGSVEIPRPVNERRRVLDGSVTDHSRNLVRYFHRLTMLGIEAPQSAESIRRELFTVRVHLSVSRIGSREMTMSDLWPLLRAGFELLWVTTAAILRQALVFARDEARHLRAAVRRLKDRSFREDTQAAVKSLRQLTSTLPSEIERRSRSVRSRNTRLFEDPNDRLFLEILLAVLLLTAMSVYSC